MRTCSRRRRRSRSRPATACPSRWRQLFRVARKGTSVWHERLPGRFGTGRRVRLSGLLELGDVLLVADVRLGVLALPLLTLLLEALGPIAGLDVEAFGVDVVALGVVLGRHPVAGGVELRLRGHTLV